LLRRTDGLPWGLRHASRVDDFADERRIAFGQIDQKAA
jgi:hypothetical protein